jgi:hypothetical protein
LDCDGRISGACGSYIKEVRELSASLWQDRKDSDQNFADSEEEDE